VSHIYLSLAQQERAREEHLAKIAAKKAKADLAARLNPELPFEGSGTDEPKLEPVERNATRFSTRVTHQAADVVTGQAHCRPDEAIVLMKRRAFLDGVSAIEMSIAVLDHVSTFYS